MSKVKEWKLIPVKGFYEKKVKIDRFLSREGICSRSEAIQLAKSGWVKVNNQLIDDVDKRLDPVLDKLFIHVDFYAKEQNSFIVVLNKPKGITSTAIKGNSRSANSLLKKDNFAQYIFGENPLVADVVGSRQQYYSLYSMEKESFGLLVLTNNRKLLKQVKEGDLFIEREYLVELEKPLVKKDLEKIYKGVIINGWKLRPKKLILEDSLHLRLVLQSDLSNQIYKLIAKASSKPKSIQCVRVEKFELGTMKPSQWIMYDSPAKFFGRRIGGL